jgi:hypothetical protein
MIILLTMDSFLRTAFQRFPLRLLSDRRAVRSYCQLAHADQPGEQGGV